MARLWFFSGRRLGREPSPPSPSSDNERFGSSLLLLLVIALANHDCERLHTESISASISPHQPISSAVLFSINTHETLFHAKMGHNEETETRDKVFLHLSEECYYFSQIRLLLIPPPPSKKGRTKPLMNILYYFSLNFLNFNFMNSTRVDSNICGQRPKLPAFCRQPKRLGGCHTPSPLVCTAPPCHGKRWLSCLIRYQDIEFSIDQCTKFKLKPPKFCVGANFQYSYTLLLIFELSKFLIP